MIMKDNDENEYKTVQIGNQIWTAENLRTTKYRNGDPIVKVTDEKEWCDLTRSAYCAYNNNEKNVKKYGYLYNWYAVNDIRKLAPEGWHVPTEQEWKVLINCLGGSSMAAYRIKTNKTEFNFTMGGAREADKFIDILREAYFWTKIEYNLNYAFFVNIGLEYESTYQATANKDRGYSVRLVKD